MMDSRAFRKVLRKAGFAGKFPSRKAFGFGGRVLNRNLEKADRVLAVPLSNAQRTGGTLTEDGAKHLKRSTQNTVFVTPETTIFVRSVNMTGKTKNQKFLTDNLEASIMAVGVRNVFLVCVDGLTSQLNAAKAMEDKFHWIFAQRCATHGGSLLLIDLATFFAEDIKLCLEIVAFILNHDEIYGAFLELGLPMVKQEVDTRFASTTIACESVLVVWDDLQSFFVSRRVKAYIEKVDKTSSATKLPSEKIAKIVMELGSVVRRERIQTFIDIVIPVRTFLRVTDSHKPHLHMIPKTFDAAVMKAMEAVAEHLQGPARHELNNLATFVKECVEKRRGDCVSRISLAAAAVNPKNLYAADRYEPAGCVDALHWAIEKYYQGDDDKINAAIKQYTQLYERSPSSYFGTPRAESFLASLDEHDVQHFFAQAAQRGGEPPRELCELGRKLVSQIGGQGASEHCNHEVSRTRTKARNRQTSETTNALMKIKSAVRYESRNEEVVNGERFDKKSVLKRTFIEALAEEFSHVREEHAFAVAEEKESANSTSGHDTEHHETETAVEHQWRQFVVDAIEDGVQSSE